MSLSNFKIDPYEECPCGSENKFKFCCYQLAREARHSSKDYSNFSESRLNHMAYQNWKDADFQVCLGFDDKKCKSVIKNAHSIQNNRILNKISKDGHVYQITSKISKQGPITIFNKISRNKASTFSGFCEFHDTELFKPIELEDYQGAPIENFLFSFRAVAVEYHKKIRLLNNLQIQFTEFPQGLLDKQIVYLYRTAQLDVKDFQRDYNLFKGDYLNDNFSNVRTIFRQLEYEIEFTTASAFAVQFDIEGNMLNDIYFNMTDERMPTFFLNVYPIGNKTNILVSYHTNDYEVYEEYFNQIEAMSNDKLIVYFNYLIIEYTENVFFNPIMIESLSAQEKESILRSFSSSINVSEKFNLFKEENYYSFNIFNPNTN